jgi:hypothetical protein
MRTGITALFVVSVALPGCLSHSVTPSKSSPVQGETVLRGVLTSVWGDPQSGGPRLLLQLTVPEGTTVPLQIPDSVLEAAGGLRALSGREVVVTVVQLPAGSGGLGPAAEVRTIRLAGPPSGGTPRR